MGFAEIATGRTADYLSAPAAAGQPGSGRRPSRERGWRVFRRATRLAYRAVGLKPDFGGRLTAPRLGASILDRCEAPVIVASHRRSGTHLTIDLLRRQFRECSAWKLPGEGLDAVYTNLDRLGLHRDPLTPGRFASLLARAPRPLLKTHATPDLSELRDVQGVWVDQLMRRAKVIYVVRDGRAVMVSAQRHEARLGLDVGRDVLDYMRLEQDGRTRVAAWKDHVERWLSMEGVLLLRYEDVVRRGEEVVARIGDFLGLEPCWIHPIAPPLVRNVWQKRAMRFTHLRPPTTALTPPTAPRSWQELFGPEEEAFFEAEAGGLMQKLGYATESAFDA
jgi:hypothetical protein